MNPTQDTEMTISRLDGGGQGRDFRVHFRLVELGDFRQHRIERARFLAKS